MSESMTAFDEALSNLYQAPFAEFVAIRKKLADGLKAGGDKEGSGRLAKLPRPPISAWAVNQLWWGERDTFEALLEVAERVKGGERDATREHREVLGKLRDAAARLLEAAGNAASETTLRRVTTTLSAVAASGGFAPDPDGALGADRDPPGFEALGAFGGAALSAPTKPARTAPETEAAERARAAEERRKESEERARRTAERERLSLALRQAQALRDAQEREASKLRAELEDKERGLRETRSLIEGLEAKLLSL